MNGLSDQQLLRDYTGSRSEAAFAELVRRHVDLVYSAAVRMVRDAHLAEDVTQSAFVALAQNAGQLTDRAVLSGWLHRTAQNIAAQTVRTEVRRRAREQEAAAMNELLAVESDAPWEQIAPHLDAALGELSEPDRDALMLRYFERKSAREMAQTLGISDEAAQKRVNRAVDRLREFIVKRGVPVGASGLVVVITANAVQAAPIGLAATISAAAALAGTTLVAATTTATLTKAIAMTTLQKAIIATSLALAVGSGICTVRQSSSLRTQVQSFQQERAATAEQIQALQGERDNAKSQLAGLREENDRLSRGTGELLKLRAENTRLRGDSAALAQLKAANSGDPLFTEAVSWKDRVKRLQQRLESTPGAKIPELQLVTEQDWLNAAKDELKTELDYRQALARLRSAGENKFVSELQPALAKCLEANNGQFPTEVMQLQAYFKSPVDSAILERWTIVPAKNVKSLGMGGDWIITQKAAPDGELDQRWGVGPNGFGTQGRFEDKPRPQDTSTPRLAN
jgi:RNA polymerase sigma factor (sigma-70 family)